MNPSNAYTPNEIAQMVGVKPSTVYAWLSRKELRSYKHGRSRYITREHLQEFYQRRSTGEYIDLTYADGPVRSYQI
jgi:excisionase family DNA binding protein